MDKLKVSREYIEGKIEELAELLKDYCEEDCQELAAFACYRLAVAGSYSYHEAMGILMDSIDWLRDCPCGDGLCEECRAAKDK